MNLNKKMEWNGNEIVFEDAPRFGVAGIGMGVPDEVAEEMVRRWNKCIKPTEAEIDTGLNKLAKLLGEKIEALKNLVTPQGNK